MFCMCGMPGCAGHTDANGMVCWYTVGVDCAPAPAVTVTAIDLSHIFAAPSRNAWECTRCQTMNAPHVDRCSCAPSTYAPRPVPRDAAPPVDPWPADPWPHVMPQITS